MEEGLGQAIVANGWFIINHSLFKKNGDSVLKTQKTITQATLQRAWPSGGSSALLLWMRKKAFFSALSRAAPVLWALLEQAGRDRLVTTRGGSFRANLGEGSGQRSESAGTGKCRSRTELPLAPGSWSEERPHLGRGPRWPQTTVSSLTGSLGCSQWGGPVPVGPSPAPCIRHVLSTY